MLLTATVDPVFVALLTLTQLAPPAPAPEFAVPFGCGRSFVVSQAHDIGTHKYHDVWAWDCRMPEGVPILAAADGVVRVARGDSTRGGCDPEFASDANYVVLAHSGAMETQYLHFERVLVKAGDHVRAGEVIGYSGKTGWACGSHLHFKVARTEDSGWNNPSVPARLVGYGDPVVNTVIRSPACVEPPMFAKVSSPEPRASGVTEAPTGAGGERTTVPDTDQASAQTNAAR
jgi:murein DD-endopeptidase MepM/ murein hydrolase activator NlpD